MKLVFLLEEPSAARFLEQFLPRWNPGVDFLCIPHQGKTDLEKSIPRKLRGWQSPQDRFVVLRDNDGQDCRKLKERLRSVCDETGRPGVLVRLACQELEAWFLGDLKAIAKCFDRPSLAQEQDKKKFRQPDRLGSPSAELKKLVPAYRKLQGATVLGTALDLDIEQNRSHSFRAFFLGLQRLINQVS